MMASTVFLSVSLLICIFGQWMLALRVRKLESQVRELNLALYGDEPAAPWDHK